MSKLSRTWHVLMTVLPQTIIPVNQTQAVGQRQRLGLKELTCQAPPQSDASPLSGFECRWSWPTKECLLEASDELVSAGLHPAAGLHRDSETPAVICDSSHKAAWDRPGSVDIST